MLPNSFKKFQIIFLASLIFIFTLPNVLRSENVNLSTVVANVNGEVITLAHLMAEVSNLSPEYLELSDEYLFENVLEQLINKLLLSELLENENLGTKTLIENNQRAIRASQSVESLLADIPRHEELKILYEKTMAAYSPEKEYSASHILLSTEDEAENLVERINEGENFAKLAAEFSIGPSSPNGGSLGWFVIGQMVPEFEAAVLSLELGMVSRPIKTEFGWHIIKLDGERLQPQPNLEELRPQLELQLRQDFLNSKLDELRDLSDINYFETNIDKAVIKEIKMLFSQ